MQGIILAGGTGSRLSPLTKVTNKHLLPVYDKPMIYYPILTLVKAGIKDIVIVLGGESIGDVVKLIGDGSEFGASVAYVHQKNAGGIAEAVKIALPIIKSEKVAIILGDNVFEDDFKEPFEKFEKENHNAMLFLKEVEDPTRFGVPTIEDGRITKIEEKPKFPDSEFAVTGLYLYDKVLLEKLIDKVVIEKGYSNRGELEITDVNNEFLHFNMQHAFVKGFWSDAGTFKSLLSSSLYVGDLD